MSEFRGECETRGPLGLDVLCSSHCPGQELMGKYSARDAAAAVPRRWVEQEEGKVVAGTYICFLPGHPGVPRISWGCTDQAEPLVPVWEGYSSE